MRCFVLVAALLAAAPLATADAQPPHPPYHGRVYHHDVPRHGWHHRAHRSCRTVWRHHHRERRCYR